MRLIVGIVLVLVGIGSVFCRLELLSADVPAQMEPAPWVRTVDGWERSDSWYRPMSSPPTLHPLVVAAAELLISVSALVACSGDSRPTRRVSQLA